MNWEEKIEAFKALVGYYNVSLKMRVPGDWYLNTSRLEIGGDGMLRTPTSSSPTPEAAVENHWRECVTDLSPNFYLVVHDEHGVRRNYRWQGHMWREVDIGSGFSR